MYLIHFCFTIPLFFRDFHRFFKIVKLAPFLVNDLPFLVNDLPFLVNDLPFLVNDLPFLVNDLPKKYIVI